MLNGHACDLPQAKAAAEQDADAARAEVEEVRQQLAEAQAVPSGADAQEAVDAALLRLIQLIYFSVVCLIRGLSCLLSAAAQVLHEISDAQSRCMLRQCVKGP